MNKYLKYIIILTLLVLIAYSKGLILSDVKSISAKEAIKIMQNKNSIVVDVRTQAEYNTHHITNAILIPIQNMPQNLTKLQQDKHKTIIVYCRSGKRSIAASKILMDKGFKPLSVKGGIKSLKEEMKK